MSWDKGRKKRKLPEWILKAEFEHFRADIWFSEKYKDVFIYYLN